MMADILYSTLLPIILTLSMILLIDITIEEDKKSNKK